MFEAITWSQLRYHDKPVGLLNVDGYYDSLLAFLDHATNERFVRPMHRSMLCVDDDIPSLLAHLLRPGRPTRVDREPMNTRTTTDKEVLDVRVHGDAKLADVLRTALHKTGPVQRWTHGFHTYPAGLHPDASRVLLKAFASRRVVDPFCGGGTALIEARAAGLETVGRDINPVALLVAKGRTTTATEDQLTAFRSAARRLTDVARTADQLPSGEAFDVLASWYAPYVLCELESLCRGIQNEDPDLRPLLEMAFSILIKTSWRRSDTNPQHVRHERPPETTSFLFHKKARELARRIRALSETVSMQPAGGHRIRRCASARYRSRRVGPHVTALPVHIRLRRSTAPSPPLVRAAGGTRERTWEPQAVACERARRWPSGIRTP